MNRELADTLLAQALLVEADQPRRRRRSARRMSVRTGCSSVCGPASSPTARSVACCSSNWRSVGAVVRLGGARLPRSPPVGALLALAALGGIATGVRQPCSSFVDQRARSGGRRPERRIAEHRHDDRLASPRCRLAGLLITESVTGGRSSSTPSRPSPCSPPLAGSTTQRCGSPRSP